MNAPLLQIEQLALRYGDVTALNGLDLDIQPGEMLGLVGESGSGKSAAALAILGLLPKSAALSGQIRYQGRKLPPENLRGHGIAMIFQDPRAALNPVRRIGQQITDVLRAHRKITEAEAEAEAARLLADVHLTDGKRLLRAYPHALSGGMCQRVGIALALACQPKLLIADEPTTALDTTTQAAIMALLHDLMQRHGMAMLFITHDLALAAQHCQRVAVIQAGRIVECAESRALFTRPRHAYTQRLIAALPRQIATQDVAENTPLLRVQNLRKQYPGLMAVEDVSLHVGRGEALGLVGESGSGKSTLALLIARLLDADAGGILFDGSDIGGIAADAFARVPQRRQIQMVFQDATGSLNPRHTAFAAIADPLRHLLGLRDAALDARVRQAAGLAGLPEALLGRLPHQLSGGQKTRIGIARAIAAEPALLVLDEPTAGLDAPVQAEILALLDNLRHRLGLALLLISHDLNVVRQTCSRIAVMQQGRIVEEAATETLFAQPQHPHSRALLAALPRI